MDRSQILESLQSVLCDPEGRVCISGSDADRSIIQAALRALESTPAQGVPELPPLPPPDVTTMERTDGACMDDVFYPQDYYEDETVRRFASEYGRACFEAALSARTAPAEGATGPRLWRCANKYNEHVYIATDNEVEAERHRQLGWNVVEYVPATTAPVVGGVDITQFREPVVHWLAWLYEMASTPEREAKYQPNIERAWKLKSLIDTARPAKAEGDGLVVKLQALVKSWREESEKLKRAAGRASKRHAAGFDSAFSAQELSEAASDAAAFADQLEATYTARTVSRGESNG